MKKRYKYDVLNSRILQQYKHLKNEQYLNRKTQFAKEDTRSSQETDLITLKKKLVSKFL